MPNTHSRIPLSGRSSCLSTHLLKCSLRLWHWALGNHIHAICVFAQRMVSTSRMATASVRSSPLPGQWSHLLGSPEAGRLCIALCAHIAFYTSNSSNSIFARNDRIVALRSGLRYVYRRRYACFAVVKGLLWGHINLKQVIISNCWMWYRYDK